MYGAATALVLGLVLVAPSLRDTTAVTLFALAVAGAAVLPVVLSSPRRKTLLLGAFAFIVPFSGIDKWFLYRLHNGGSAGVQLSIADLVMLVLYVVWLWESLNESRHGDPAPRPLNGPLLAGGGFIALLSLSVINAVSPELVAFELWQTVKLLLWLVYLGNNVRTLDHLRAMAAGIVAAVLLHSGFAVAEKLTGGSLGLGILGEQEGVTVGLFAGQYTRAGGLIGHPVLLGAFFALTLPFLLAVIAGARRRWTRVAGVVAVVAGAAGLALTLSRGAVIAWTFSFGFFISALALRERLKGKARDAILALVAVLVIAAVVASPVIFERFVFSDPGSVSGRQQLADLALRVITDHPVLGVGLNNWPRVMAAYDTTGISLLATDPVHSFYLLVWAETGIVGLAGFGLFAVVLLANGLGAARRAVVPEVQIAALAAVTSTLAILIMGLASWELRLTPEHQLFWLVAGLIVAVSRMSVPAGAARSRAHSGHRAGSPFQTHRSGVDRTVGAKPRC